MKSQTLSDWVRWGARQLNECGTAGARREAELLLVFAAGMSREAYYLHDREILPAGQAILFEQAVLRRCRREPLAYITGHREFYGLDLSVTPDVLIPRPETELLVETGLERLREMGVQAPLVVDACTGSGAIAVAIAFHAPVARVAATDISEAALEVARGNARLHGVGDRISFRQGDLLAPVADLSGKVDLLLSNPPYIPAGQIDALEPEVSEYEPRLALSGGPDGLDIYRRLCRDAVHLVRPGGSMLLEIGHDQGEPVLQTARDYGWQGTWVPDLAGLQRMVIVVHP